MLGVLLRDAEDLLDRREARAGLGPRIVPQRRHALLDGVTANLARGRAAHDEAAGFVGDAEQLVDPDPASVAGAPALVAALAAEELHARRVGDADREQLGRVGPRGSPARLSDAAHQPL